ncbi:MAG: TRIC cation channel family protein, partial [Lamprobacter sp.]|uniref:trimeric intracellular cation channel family protein n=1 Tax=Lamprobacter sp. TaxID=3100796 RepID=UPI002B25DB54
MDILYLLGLVATAAFAASGILAAMGTRIDLFGAVVVAIVTALGGGTLRDLMLDAPVFWLHDPAFMTCATLTGVLAFLGRAHLNAHGNLLAYLDAMGVALFASGAFIKSTELGLPPAHALAMGVITGIGGGLLRDTLTGRETL